MLKKLSIAGYIEIVAAILGIAGVVTLIISGTMNSAYSISGFTLAVVLAVVGVILTLVAIYTPMKMGNADIVSTLCLMVTVFCYVYTIGQAFMDRVLMISGLMSWNSQNTAAWNVLYVTIACAVCLGVSAVLLIIGSFINTVKEKKA